MAEDEKKQKADSGDAKGETSEAPKGVDEDSPEPGKEAKEDP